ncbi:MAG: hypothetical protein LUH63_05410 [Parabacteroides sp.]|nr:hypothetical protein [Parabacteroides sp.]
MRIIISGNTISIWSFFPDPERKVYSLFADNTIPRVFLADKNGTIILTQTEKVDAEEIQAKVY